MLPQGLLLGIYIALVSSCFLDLLAVMKRDLMMLQQNSYRNERYTRWFNMSGESTTPWRIGACIALFLLLVHHLPQIVTAVLAIVILLANFFSYTFRRYKKPLVFTKRATRIYIVQLLLGVSAPLVLGLVSGSLYLAAKIALFVIIISPVFLLVANLLLSPVEKAINRRYYNEARNILRANGSLKIIGITGSYGKTSTKHFLQHMLATRYETVMTPGSFNTLLGVVRTIREYLKPYTQVFIVEMGAKQQGDIKEICDLVCPSVGIITSIGPQHLETFKTIDNVLGTKMELAEALPSDGLAVINNTNQIVDGYQLNNTEVIYYGTEADSYTLTDVEVSSGGTAFSVCKGGEMLMRLSTPVMGKANLENILGAIIVALRLGLTEKEIRYAVATLPQVEHRLQVIHVASGYTILDDAYNSNPTGASMALDVMSSMKTPGKKIIITPGMIELGDEQYEANKEFGKQIGQSVDMAIVVGAYNRDAILEGLEESGMNNTKIFTAQNFNEAQKLLLIHVAKGDVVLYENDLPDTFK